MNRYGTDIGPFGIVPLWLLQALDGKTAPIAVYVVIASHAYHDGWKMSRQQIADEACCSVDTVKRSLRTLRDVGAIEVQANYTDDGDQGWSTYFVRHADPAPRSVQDHPGVGADLHPPGGQNPPRSYNPQEEPSTEVSQVVDLTTRTTEALCNQLADSLEQRTGKRPNVTQAWRTDMERLLRIDQRDEVDVAKVINWLHDAGDPIAGFWAPNIRSPRKLREKWDQMAEQYRNRVVKGVGQRNDGTNAVRRMRARQNGTSL